MPGAALSSLERCRVARRPHLHAMAPTNLRVLGLCGSLRKDSFNRWLLRAAGELMPAGMTMELFDGLQEVPPYDGDVEAAGFPPPVVRLQRAIREADALLVATPEYNYGVPGVLKNALDWASRPAGASPLNGKPAAVMGASPAMTGTARAQLALRQSFVFTDTRVMSQPEIMVSRAPERFDAGGRLVDEATRRFLGDFLTAFARWVEGWREGAPRG
jgi:chromate reductase